jgi:hypothetical protein
MPSSQPKLLTLGLLTFTSFFAGGVGIAHASGSPFGNSAAKAIYLSSGGNVGAATHLDGNGTGVLLGGEVSVFDTKGLKSDFTLVPQGFYLDVLRDAQSKSLRFSIGPELVAYPFVGFDVGLVLENARDELSLGTRLRYFVPFIFVLPYVGLTITGTEFRTVLESGVLLKVPLILYER